MTTIFLAEDEPMFLEKAKEVLESAGYRVIAFDDGQELVEALGTETCDIVVTDFQMRRSNGIWVLRMVRERFPTMPVIVWTSNDRIVREVEALGGVFLYKGYWSTLALNVAMKSGVSP